MKDKRSILRVGFAILILLSLSVIVTAFLDRSPPEPLEVENTSLEGGTVVTTQSSPGDTNGDLRVYDQSGDLVQYRNQMGSYWDVDPLGGDRIMYLATEPTNVGACSSTDCFRHVIRIANLSTGETTTVYERVVADARWHDVDRIAADRYLVADITTDRVVIINTTTDLEVWAWHAGEVFDLETGHGYSDWTHLNDVEMLPDGRIMASPRNQDQVLFIHPNGTLDREWTLGCDDCYDTLHEQHNPDYIPASDGGPAVLVADSESHRVVEYQRRDGEWHQSWAWQDSKLTWPRDADRLPSGHTLVTDSNGGRVLEVAENGSVVWEVSLASPYEAERLGTGAESRGGASAESLGLQTRVRQQSESGSWSLRGAVIGLFPGKVVSIIAFVTPHWAGFAGAAAAGIGLATLLVWIVVEAWWSPWTIRSPLTRRE